MRQTGAKGGALCLGAFRLLDGVTYTQGTSLTVLKAEKAKAKVTVDSVSKECSRLGL